MTYAIQAGREPALSLTELIRIFNISHKDVSIVDDVVIIINGELPGTALFTKLGGSIKMAEYVGEYAQEDFVANSVAVLTECVAQSEIKDFSGAFALNVFGRAPQAINKKKKQIGIALKKQLKGKYSHVRFVESNEAVTSSVTVRRNKLLRGADLWLVFRGAELTVFRTVAVQDYQGFSKRDYGRPKSDARSGMLPPKLARMMINISGADEKSVVFDPFVGSGTVLLEAADLGVKQLIGSDIDEKAVADTKQNLAWFCETHSVTVDEKLFVSKIASVDPKDVESATHLIGEIDLGNPLRDRATRKAAEGYAQHATLLIEQTLELIMKLPHCTTCVIAIPFWIQKDGHHVFTPHTVPLGLHGDPVVQEVAGMYPDEVSKRGGLLYMRDDQFVGREIIIFKRKKGDNES